MTPLTLVMMAGLPGSGKSTLAAALGRELNWPVLDKDRVHTVLADRGMAQAEAGPLAYDITFALVDNLLTRQRCSLILDTAGRQPSILTRAQEISHAAEARLRVIRCVAPREVRLGRMLGRVALPSQWSNDDISAEKEAAWYTHLPADTLILDTSPSPEELARIALAFIQH